MSVKSELVSFIVMRFQASLFFKSQLNPLYGL